MAITFDKMKDFDFNSLNFEELTFIYNIVGDILKTRREDAKKDYISEIINKANELGLDIDFTSLEKQAKLKKQSGTRKPIGKVKPKYQIEIDGEINTWSGRGRTPVKIASKLDELNITVEQFKEDQKYRVPEEE